MVALVAVVTAMLTVIGGATQLVASALTGDRATTVQPAAESTEQRRDRIAAAPMLRASAADALPGAAASVPQPAAYEVPPASIDGPTGVESGFPRTEAGAVAQLAAIEVRVLSAMSLEVASQVQAAWVAPGGPSMGEWRLASGVRAFLSGARMGTERERGSYISVRPVGAMVKGSDGPDWLVACVLVEIRAIVTVEAKAAYGHCERMQYDHGRWMIGPGAQPADAPSTWPGTTAWTEAGWRPWATETRQAGR